MQLDDNESKSNAPSKATLLGDRRELLVAALGLGFFLLLVVSSFFILSEEEPSKKMVARRPAVFDEWGAQFFDSFKLPKHLQSQGKDYVFTYTLHEEFEAHVTALLKRYHPDFGAVVVIDNDTGALKVAIDYARKTKLSGRSLAFSATHPAASVIKIITAADLIENAKIKAEDPLFFRGKRTTLYKHQLKVKPSDRWKRKTTLKRAFGYSNNSLFGRLAIQASGPEQLLAMAEKFQFNNEILSELKEGQSQFHLAKDDFELAELASGFNRKTLISPLHAALFPLIVVNGGLLQRPYLIETVYDVESGSAIWTPEMSTNRVLSKKTAKILKDLMQQTTQRGTARRYFRRFSKKNRFNIDVGGKTGSLTGGVPHGKRDWFVCFATPEGKELGKGISVAVMLVNQKKWYIKSTFLAKKVIDYYYDHVFPLKNYQQMATKASPKKSTERKSDS